MFKSLTCLAALASAALAAPATVATVPAGFEITSSSLSGTGCPTPESAVFNYDAESAAFSMVYTEFVTTAGPGLPNPGHKECVLSLNLTIPEGYSVSVPNFTPHTDGENNGAWLNLRDFSPPGAEDFASACGGAAELTWDTRVLQWDEGEPITYSVDSIDSGFIFTAC
ncbi:hypothetical protein D9611_008858 [Ephemerocybe angulata]|uniref:Ubiquitin 3 binding protein But2 C-terminal domain-containing protein n=1 Tax=Ephemerocybe angulata TaxID=980116 RepID=A0A8H5FCL6_9AGAR|nr:hypothetical protein D9611_008858 [Tulosesus angulatus]